MASKKTRKSINHYQRLIHHYLKRRESYKLKYGTKSKPYINAYRKVDSYRKSLRRCIERRKKIKLIAESIFEYMGVDVQKTKKKKKTEYSIARGIFYKYGMQNGCIGKELSDYINSTRWAASEGRRSFTRKLSSDKHYKEMYHGFLNFLKRKDVN